MMPSAASPWGGQHVLGDEVRRPQHLDRALIAAVAELGLGPGPERRGRLPGAAREAEVVAAAALLGEQVIGIVTPGVRRPSQTTADQAGVATGPGADWASSSSQGPGKRPLLPDSENGCSWFHWLRGSS